MRLWSLHPKYLDTQGLLALWREALLAQKVLQGKTRAYRNHPQLSRFKACHSPRTAIAGYLRGVWEEARRRGYDFNERKIGKTIGKAKRIPVTNGQLRFEKLHLMKKLRKRSPEGMKALRASRPQPHPGLKRVPGPVEPWEKR